MESLIPKIIAQIETVVLGKTHEVKLSLACVLAKGHILIEDLPGMGKTTLAQVLAKSLGLSYQRTQFTSDLLPSDVIGISIFEQSSQTFVLHKGPIFNQVVLADEINRASPKTQSSLLEAMEEQQVSIDGKTHSLPDPFFVIATQNPLFHAGTNPLPESQLDRFMMRIALGYPNASAERQILLGGSLHEKLAAITPFVSVQQLLAIQKQIESVTTTDAILDYVIALCRETRKASFQGNPLSPRAGKSIVQAAKAWAFIDNRDYVTPDDVKAVFASVADHRIEISSVSAFNERSSLSNTILEAVDVISPLPDMI